jgi:hypothetical protein
VPLTTHDLDTAWQQTARSHHFSDERIEVLRHQDHAPLQPAAAADVLAGLTEFDATFPARDARAVALERSAGSAIDAALEHLRELRNSEEILVLADGTGTTRSHRGRERTIVAITQRLTETQITPLPAGAAKREADRLDRELSARGGRLADEQRAAIRLACGSRPLVLIERQAGTGKSTALTGIARAHKASGQQIVVTSTAALAAERLASELTGSGVDCHAYSTAGLASAIKNDRIALTSQTTIIHDEAALASTREQLDLLDAVETTGARLIAVGDPQQNQPVGAGSLWQHIEDATRDADAHVEVTNNQRARDPADRRDQALFRHGHTERAIRGYAARERVHFYDDPRRAEDHALEAAHRDRTDGKTTTVISQTSNDDLDALNARAQAIRHQAGELGDDSLPIAGRPYELRHGDLVQIRHTIQHAEHGPLRNGAAAQVIDIDADAIALALRLSDGTALGLTEQQITDADLRLAYVQHPFPAQGQTTNTTHLIVGEHATREGTYVGLTRARETTNIHVGDSFGLVPDADQLQRLADHVNRTEPDAPSIRIPLAPGAALDPEVRIEATTPGNGLGITARPGPVSRAGADEPQSASPVDTERDSRATPKRKAEAAIERVPRGTRDREPVAESAEKEALVTGPGSGTASQSHRLRTSIRIATGPLVSSPDRATAPQSARMLRRKCAVRSRSDDPIPTAPSDPSEIRVSALSPMRRRARRLVPARGFVAMRARGRCSTRPQEQPSEHLSETRFSPIAGRAPKRAEFSICLRRTVPAIGSQASAEDLAGLGEDREGPIDRAASRYPEGKWSCRAVLLSAIRSQHAMERD